MDKKEQKKPKLNKICFKTLYFQRKYKDNYTFPLIIEAFLLYLQRNLIKEVSS